MKSQNTGWKEKYKEIKQEITCKSEKMDRNNTIKERKERE